MIRARILTALAIAAGATTLAACSSGQAATIHASPGAAGQRGSAVAAGATAPETARVGGTLTVRGPDWEPYALDVTLVQVAASAQAAQGYPSAPVGARYEVVQLRLTNTGASAYSEYAPAMCTGLDALGQSYNPAYIGTAIGQPLGDVHLAPGAIALGTVAFAVPVGTTLTKLQVGAPGVDDVADFTLT